MPLIFLLNVGALAEKIEEFMKHPMSEDERGRQIKMVRARYNRDNIARKTLNVCERVKEFC